MPVIFLTDWNGFYTGERRTFDSAEEARLIAARICALDAPSISQRSGQENFANARRLNLTADNFGVQWADSVNVATNTVIYAGTEPAGWVRHFFDFGTLFGAGNAVINDAILADLIALLTFWKGRGKKILICFDAAPNNTLSMLPTLVRDRLLALLPRLTDRGKTPLFIDAVGIANEPLAALTALYPGAQQTTGVAKLAEMQRTLFTIFRKFSPSTIIVSPEFQGGEGGMIEPMLRASAAGVSVFGSTGAGTRGEQYMDVIGYHPYSSPLLTLADVKSALNNSVSSRFIREYSVWITEAIASRRANPDGGSAYWAGRPDPECWASEYNICPIGATTASNLEFRFQALSSAEKTIVLEQQLLGAFAAGYKKAFLYAVDHYSLQGPFPAGGTRGAEPNGDLRILNETTIRVLDGDVVQWYTAGYAQLLQAVAYNCTIDGYSYSLAGIPSATTFFQLELRTRAMLGGWHKEWAAVQASLMGLAEVGFVAGEPGDTPVPALRVNSGDVQVTVDGRRFARGAKV